MLPFSFYRSCVMVGRGRYGGNWFAGQLALSLPRWEWQKGADSLRIGVKIVQERIKYRAKDRIDCL
jgi:hypothetical protein